MEPDRFDNNNTLYIVGIICLILCISLILFSLYIVPYLIWQLSYDVPDFILGTEVYFQESQGFGIGASKGLVWLIFFAPGLILGFISYYISNYMDNKIYHIEDNASQEPKKHMSTQTKMQLRDSASIGLKIILLMIIVVSLLLLLAQFL